MTENKEREQTETENPGTRHSTRFKGHIQAKRKTHTVAGRKGKGKGHSEGGRVAEKKEEGLNQDTVGGRKIERGRRGLWET